MHLNFIHHTKENIFGEFFVTGYAHIKWARLFTELTGESRTKIAQAKSKGLVRTLISEALTAQKNWEEIKDSL